VTLKTREPASGKMTAVSVREAVPAPALRTRRIGWLDGVLVAALALATFAVHDVHYVLNHPFWTDEAWVAVQSRFSLGALPRLTSTTPIGWSFLIRLVPAGGQQRARLVPLLFALLTVLVAYWFAYNLPWRARWQSSIAGVLGGGAALLAPSMLIRDDLKQYTADAFFAVLVLGCTARIEQTWSRKRLAALGAVSVVGMLFSLAAAFVGAAAFIAVLALTIGRRNKAKTIEAAVATAATAIGLAGVYGLVYARAIAPGLTTYWQAFYIAHNGSGVRFVVRSVGHATGNMGFGPDWVALPLIGIGLITLWRIGRSIVVVTALALCGEMLVLAAADKYPFLDPRTSTFLTVLAGVIVAIGIVGLGSLVVERLTYIAIAISVIAAVVYVSNVHSFIDAHNIPAEDIRSQVEYITAHRQPGDVVLVNLSGNWGFGYYWTPNSPSYRRSDAVVQGYVVDYPASDGIVIATDRTAVAVQQALAKATGLASRRHGRIWLIRTHIDAAESVAWSNSIAPDRPQAVLAVGEGDELTLLRP
jgi:hypothetical protein